MSLDLVQGLSLMRQRLAEDRYLAVLITTRPGRDEPQGAVVWSNPAGSEHLESEET
jgi:hypothetical protein